MGGNRPDRESAGESRLVACSPRLSQRPMSRWREPTPKRNPSAPIAAARSCAAKAALPAGGLHLANFKKRRTATASAFRCGWPWRSWERIDNQQAYDGPGLADFKGRPLFRARTGLKLSLLWPQATAAVRSYFLRKHRPAEAATAPSANARVPGSGTGANATPRKM